MAIPTSNVIELSTVVEKIKSIDARLTQIRTALGEAETTIRNAEHNHKRFASKYEELRLERVKLLCQLRGQNYKEDPDVLSSTILSHVDYKSIWERLISSRKLQELEVAGIVFIGDLAQSKVIKSHGKPLSLHPRLSDGTWRNAGVPVVGAKTIQYLETILAKHELTFGTVLSDWIRPINLEKLPGEIRSHDELFNMEAGKFLESIRGGAPWVMTRQQYSKYDSEPAMLIGDLVQMSEREVLKLEYLGPKELGYIKQKLSESGLSLEMKLPNWVRPQR